MGIYNGAVITSTGQALLAQSVAGSELKFTTIKTSNYVYPAGTSLADLTTLTGIKQSKNITGATVYNSRVIKISAMVDNAGVAAEYSINTIGVYATIGTAAEQLFAVITAQEADKMPAFNSRPYSYIYDMNMTMQGTANITVTVNNAGFVNINDLNNALDGVNESITDLDETVNGRIDTLSSSVDTRISALNDALSSPTTQTVQWNAILSTDRNKKSLNVNSYKYMKLRATFPNGGYGETVVDCRYYHTGFFGNVFIHNGYPDSSNFYGMMTVLVESTGLTIASEHHGTGITGDVTLSVTTYA